MSGISRKLLLKPGAVPSILAADLKENVGERGRRLADRNQRSIVESLLKDVQHLPENKGDNEVENTSTEHMNVDLDQAEVSNAVTISGSEDILVQQDSEVYTARKNDSQAQIKILENKLYVKHCISYSYL